MSAQRILCRLLPPPSLTTESQKPLLKMLDKNLQNSCHPKTKSELAQENVQVMVLFSGVKLRRNPLLLNTRARCYL